MAYLEAHGAAMKIPPEAVTALKPKQAIFEAAYAEAKEPEHGHRGTQARVSVSNPGKRPGSPDLFGDCAVAVAIFSIARNCSYEFFFKGHEPFDGVDRRGA